MFNAVKCFLFLEINNVLKLQITVFKTAGKFLTYYVTIFKTNFEKYHKTF